MSYDPTIGRFISEDPIAFDGGDANLYRFVGNGPTDGTDPTGLADKPLYPGYKKLKEKFPDAPDWPDIMKDKDVRDTIQGDFQAQKQPGFELGGWILWNPKTKDTRVSHDKVRHPEKNKSIFPVSGPSKFDNGDPIGDYIVIGFYRTHPTNDTPSPVDFEDSGSPAKNSLPGLIIGPNGKLTTYYQSGADPRKGVTRRLTLGN